MSESEKFFKGLNDTLSMLSIISVVILCIAFPWVGIFVAIVYINAKWYDSKVAKERQKQQQQDDIRLTSLIASTSQTEINRAELICSKVKYRLPHVPE